MAGYGGDPVGNPTDELRFLIGDTDEDSPLLTDSEVAYWLTKHENINCAALHAARSLLTRYSTKRSKTVGPTTISYGDVVANLENLLPRLADQCPGRGKLAGPPTAGGVEEPMKSTAVDFTNNRG